MPGRLIQQTWTADPTTYAPAKYRRACRYDAFVPDKIGTLDVRIDGALAGVVADAEHAIQSLNDRAAATLAPMARLLLRTESIASSKVEGMQLGARELARAEARLETGGKASQMAMDLLANIDAMLMAVDDGATVPRFSTRQIVEIHHRLMSTAENHHVAGRVRAEQNWIGGNDHNPCGADFVPPPAEHVAELLDDLCRAINDDQLPALMQAALVHAQFETIHPFHDGNGRTGRALVQVVLRRRRIAPRFVPPISVVLAAAKDRYIAGLTSFRGPHVQPWLEYFAAASARATALAASYTEAVDALRLTWHATLAASDVAPRGGATAWALIDALPGYPTITAGVATAIVGRSKPQTYQAIEQLVVAGVLLPLSDSRRNRAWEAAGLLELVERLDAGRALGREAKPASRQG